MVEVADFDSIREKNAVTQPIEAVRQDDLAFGADRNAIKFHGGDDFVAIAQVDLALMWVGKSVGLPKSHGSIIA